MTNDRKGTPTAWTAELDVVRACARLHMHERDVDSADRAIRRGVAWDAVLAIAASHGLTPLLHRHATTGAVVVPAATAAALRSSAEGIARRNLLLTSELLALLKLFSDRRVPVVPLKGPVLAEAAYGSIALRRVRDLDLLFDEADLPRVEALLESRGYVAKRNFSAALDSLARRKAHHLVLMASGNGLKVEAHHYLIPAYGGPGIGLASIRPRLRRATFVNQAISTLAPEDQVVYLCQHGASHAWSCLEWLVAVAELLRQGQVAWGAIVDRASEVGEERRVTAAVRLAIEILGPIEGLDLPAATTAGDARIASANRRVIHRLQAEPTRVIARISEPFEYQLSTDAGAVRRLRRLWTTFAGPTPSDSFGLVLPRGLWPLYYAIRPARLVAHHWGLVRTANRPTTLGDERYRSRRTP